MEQTKLSGTTRTERPTGMLANFARRFAALKLFVCALFLSSAVYGQTITVDGSPADWPAVLSGTSASFKTTITDPVNSHSDDVWTRGSQSTDPITGWHWTLGNTNDKTDMHNTGLAMIGHNVYFFADMYADNGDASIGFWLLKGGVAPTSGGNFTGTHVDGDILVSIAYTHGHRTATPTIYKWIGGALTHVAVGPTVAGAATNSVSVTAPWPYTPKHGSSGTYPANSFFEGFVNLDSLGGTFNSCFGSFVFQTWESQSPHAALADLVLGSFPAGPSVTLANDTVCAGSGATFTASATGGTGLTYSWNGGSFGTSNTYTVGSTTTSGIVTVKAKSATGCTTATDTAHLVVRPGISVTLPNDTVCAGSGATFTASASGGTSLTYSWNGGSFSSSATYTVGSATSSGIVTVAVRSTNGCMSVTDTAHLVVRAVPSITTSCSNVSYCSGTSVSGFTFGSTTGTMLSWTSTANVGFGTSGTGNIGAFTAMTGSTAVTATVTVTPSNGSCPGNPVRFTICVNPAPAMTAVNATVCAGASVGLSGSPAGGTWSGYGVSGTSFNAAGISPGVYTVSYWKTGAGGCTGSATATVTVTNCDCGSGKNGMTAVSPNSYGVYPNPSNGSFVLNVPALKQNAEVIVSDLYGRVIDQRTIDKSDIGQQLNYNISDATPGIYYLKVNAGANSYSDKIMLK